MALTIFLSGHLKELSGGATEIALAGTHRVVEDALVELWSQHLALRDRVLDEQGNIRRHVNIFCDGADIKRGDSLRTPVTEASQLHIFNAVSGG